MNVTTIRRHFEPLVRQAGPGRTGRRSAAFTLIELLVVIGLIALLSGGVGLALRDTGANELANAQIVLATLVGTTRAQAAVLQTEARLLIHGTRPPAGDGEKFLRLLQVVTADPAGSGNWRAAGEPVFLPRGIYVVPDSTEGLVAPDVVWPAGATATSSLGAATFNPALDSGAFGGAHWLEFRADGSVGCADGAEGTIRVLLTVGRKENDLPRFTHPSRVRGLLVRPTGAVAFLNKWEDF